MIKRHLAIPAVVAGTLLALAAPTAASAHVSASASSSAPGAYTVVTLSVPHGCEGSPTQVVTIDIPESVPSVTPTINPLWTVEKVMVPLDEPVESTYGEPLTERVGQIVYTSTTGGLEDGFRDVFALSLQLPQGEEGDAVEFRTTQTCTEGTAVWEGEDVPSVVLAGAAEAGHGASDEATSDDEASDDETATTTAAEGDASAASATTTATGQGDVLARVLGVLGLLVGTVGVALAIISRRAARASA